MAAETEMPNEYLDGPKFPFDEIQLNFFTVFPFQWNGEHGPNGFDACYNRNIWTLLFFSLKSVQ